MCNSVRRILRLRDNGCTYACIINVFPHVYTQMNLFIVFNGHMTHYGSCRLKFIKLGFTTFTFAGNHCNGRARSMGCSYKISTHS